MTVSSTPEGVSVQPRHLHFDVSEDLKTFWHGDDAFRTAFFNALSLQFPDGEQQFINAVRLYRDRIDDPKLKVEIRGFIGQEALHSRELGVMTLTGWIAVFASIWRWSESCRPAGNWRVLAAPSITRRCWRMPF